MKLLSLKIEKKNNCHISNYSASEITKLFTSQNKKNKNKILKKEKIILLKLLRLLHYFFHKSNA